MSERISPETEMLWSAYDKGECGTDYLKNKMAEMETERDEMVKLAWELRDALQMANEWSKLYVGHEGTYAKILTKAKEVLP